MKHICENYYKLCRNTAGLSQLDAADLLHISEKSLSDYENGKTKVPDDIVDSMAQRYRSPLLAWWHLKNTNMLGKYLPDVAMPQTAGDMAFQVILAQDELNLSAGDIKRIMADGKITTDELEELKGCIDAWRSISNKILSAALYGEQTINESMDNAG